MRDPQSNERGQLDLSAPQRGMLRALYYASGDRTLRALARRAGTTPAGARRTLISLEDRGLVREQANGTFSLLGSLPEGIDT